LNEHKVADTQVKLITKKMSKEDRLYTMNKVNSEFLVCSHKKYLLVSKVMGVFSRHHNSRNCYNALWKKWLANRWGLMPNNNMLQFPVSLNSLQDGLLSLQYLCHAD